MNGLIILLYAIGYIPGIVGMCWPWLKAFATRSPMPHSTTQLEILFLTIFGSAIGAIYWIILTIVILTTDIL